MGVFRTILLFALAASAAARAEAPDVARLTKAAQAGHAYDRGAAIAALGGSKDPKAIPALTAILKSGQGGLRFQALEALAALGDRKALFELLPTLLDDHNPSIRQRSAAVLAGLWKTRDAAEIKILVAAFTKCLEDEYQSVRRAAAGGLLKMPSPDAKKTLAGAVSSSDLFVRQQALKLLERHVQPETIPHLKKLCGSENHQNRMSALKALVRHKPPGVLTVLKSALSDENTQVRELAVRLSAGHMKDAELSDAIGRILAEDPIAKVRAAAAEALRSTGPNAQGALTGAALFADEDLTVRLKALSSLGAVGDSRCLPFLEILRQDAHKKLAEGAENARRAIRARAAKLGPQEQAATAGSTVLDRLLAVHEGRMAVLRRMAVLGRQNTLQDGRGRPSYEDGRGRPSHKGQDGRGRPSYENGRGRPSYEGVYESFLERMRDPDPFVSRAARKAAVQLLELAAGKDRKLLLKILKHPELDLRIAAMKAISSSLGADAHPILAKALKERHEGTRAAAAEQIRKLAEQKTKLPKAVIQALLKALKDSSEEVRYQARGALRALAGQDYRFDADRWNDWYQSQSERSAKELALHPVPGVLREEVSFEPVGKLLLPFGSPRDVIVRGNSAYMATGEGGVALYDLSKPETPRLADRYVTRVPGHVTEGHGWARYANGVCNQIAAVGDRLYLTASHSGFATSGVELTVLDISKPGRLRFMGSLPPVSRNHTHGAIAAAGNLVYSVQGKKRTSLVIYDFTDAERPRRAASYKAKKSISAIAVSGKFVVVGQGAAGLRVIEVDEPDSPQARDFHPIAGKISSVIIHGGQVAIGTDKNELHLLKLETDGILVDLRKVPLD
ncbi:MAG: HEAT repeat domain-containing protein, partial [Planctomycetota bacterium]|nr:HEAT repeat domain-containing protein [Planctomycetota bacterium]